MRQIHRVDFLWLYEYATSHANQISEWNTTKIASVCQDVANDSMQSASDELCHGQWIVWSKKLSDKYCSFLW